MSQAIDDLLTLLHGDGSHQACFVNADCANISTHAHDYLAVLRSSARVFADGAGMRLAGRILRQPIRENVNGTDLFPLLCARLGGTGLRVYLLGGKPGVARQVAAWMRKEHPRVEIAGYRDGYFSHADEQTVIAEIASSNAQLLLVAFGSPKQDLWIARHLPNLNIKVAMGVGGLFDFYSGNVPRAPAWMRELGLEWCYRMWREPARLAQRYLVGNPLFLFRVLRASRSLKKPQTASDRMSRCPGTVIVLDTATPERDGPESIAARPSLLE
jgi:N-acetylglucosaminyldiphosphoundecaprenol N-acetyl-beta-D-mannosaminyltransferase